MSFWTERFEESEHDETDYEVWRRQDEYDALCEALRDEEME